MSSLRLICCEQVSRSAFEFIYIVHLFLQGVQYSNYRYLSRMIIFFIIYNVKELGQSLQVFTISIVSDSCSSLNCHLNANRSAFGLMNMQDCYEVWTWKSCKWDHLYAIDVLHKIHVQLRCRWWHNRCHPAPFSTAHLLWTGNNKRSKLSSLEKETNFNLFHFAPLLRKLTFFSLCQVLQ